MEKIHKLPTRAQLLSEKKELHARLEEAEDTLRAIRSGEVDALILEGPAGHQVFTLKGAEHGYRILVETMTEGAVTLRNNGMIFYCNARFATMVKLPLEKVMGLRLQQFFAPDKRSVFEALLGQNSQDRREEFMLFASDGTPVPVLVSMSALTEEAPGSFCVVLTDLSVQKHAATLERVVLERTAELREKIGELEAFSYSLSHDMRQPLRAMKSFVLILLEDFGEKFDGEPREFLEKISASTDRLDRLIQDVLSYSQTTRSEDKLRVLDLNKIVRGVLEGNSNAGKAKIEVVDSTSWVRGNETGLTQSITNLLTNAVKFVSPGKIPQIRIWSEVRGGFIRLWVQDNGIGIAPEDQGKIFEMFQRLHREDDFEGTGIGLSIVRKSAEKMGGRVGVESKLGEGSRFWIELQIADAV
jgi:PAS domain S-box-containing protein